MASGKIKGITVEIGGDTTKLGKAISDTEKHTRSLQGELRQVEKLLKLDPSNTELLAQKQKLLTEAVADTSKKLEILKEAEEQVIAQFERGEIGEDQLRAFQREIIKTENELNGFRNELDGTADEVQDVGDAAEDSSEGFTVLKGALADLVSNAIQGAISAIGNFISSLLELSEATEEYRQMQAKLEGSANNFGYSIDFANEKYKQFYRYMGDDMAANNAITNLMGLGTSTESVSSLANAAISVWTAYGDSIPIEGLTEALNETAQVGQVTGSLADALNWAGISEDDFNKKLEKCSSTQERADLIAKTLNDTYGKSKKTYDEVSKSILDANDAELELKETQAKLGEIMTPVNTALTNLKNQALKALAPLVETVANAFVDLYNYLQQHPALLAVIATIVITLATAFTVLATALGIEALINGVTKAFAFLNTTLLANPIVLVVAAIAGLVAAFIFLWNTCEGFRNFFISLGEGLLSVLNTVITFVSNNWQGLLLFLLNPFIGAFKLLYDNCESFRTFVNNFVEKIKQFFIDAGNKIVSYCSETIPKLISNITNWFTDLGNKIQNSLSDIKNKIIKWGSDIKNKMVTAITNMVNSAYTKAQELPNKLYSAIKGAITQVTNWGSSLGQAAGSAIKTMINTCVSIASSLPGKFVTIGREIINGIKSGISSAVSGLYATIKSSLSGLVTKAKNALGINSPSKVFASVVGKAIPEGIAKGIDDNSNYTDDAISDLSQDMLNQGINGVTLTRQLDTTFKGTVSTDSQLLNKLNAIIQKLDSKTQIVLDTGTLVGETVDAFDEAFANRKTQLARGW